MFSAFRLMSDIASLEGGSDSTCKYRYKCNFDQPRSGRLNKGTLKGTRVCKVILLVLLIAFYIMSFIGQILVNYNPIAVTLTYYSMWGILLALFAQIFSMIACTREGWFKIAYITTEIAYAVNAFIMLAFWVILIPNAIKNAPKPDPNVTPKPMTGVQAFMAFQGIFIHIIPFVSCVTDLWLTDMALEKSHWWIAFVTMCPVYMIPNLVGSMTMGSMMITGEMGTIYGYEDWYNPV